MRMSTIAAFAGTLLALVHGVAFAQEPLESGIMSEEAPVSAPSTDPFKANPFAVAPIDDGALRTVAGREDTTQVSQADQVAGVSRNSVGNNSVTGDAQIAGNAFQNMSGLSILNVNTGNNVAINAAMNVNVSINAGQ